MDSPTTRFTGIDHVQLAIPVDDEPTARDFSVGVIGMDEIPKAPPLAARGARFSAAPFQVHVDAPFGSRLELIEADGGAR